MNAVNVPFDEVDFPSSFSGLRDLLMRVVQATTGDATAVSSIGNFAFVLHY